MVVLNFAPVFLIASANCCFPSGLSTTMSLTSGTLIFGPQCATHKPKTFNTMNANDCFGVRDSKAKDQHLPRLRHLKFLDQSNMIDLCLSFSLNLFTQFILMVCISSFWGYLSINQSLLAIYKNKILYWQRYNWLRTGKSRLFRSLK